MSLNRVEETQALQQMIANLDEQARIIKVARDGAISRLREINAPKTLREHYGFVQLECIRPSQEAIDYVKSQYQNARFHNHIQREYDEWDDGSGLLFGNVYVHAATGEIKTHFFGRYTSAIFHFPVEIAFRMWEEQHRVGG